MLAAKTAGLARTTGTEVEGILFANTGFQSGLVRLAEGYRIRLAKVRKDQNRDAFTIAFAGYDSVTRKVVSKGTGIGITEQINQSDAVRVQPNEAH